MANYEINYGVKTLQGLSSPIFNSSLGRMKKDYGNVIEEVAKNSNIDPSLLYGLMYVISNGKNLSPYKTNDKLVRQGIFGLSQKTAKQIVVNEMQNNRMNSAEKELLMSLDPAIASYLSDEKGTKGFNEHWKADTSVKHMISDTLKPWNLQNPKVSAQIQALWLGQLLDYYGQQTNKPVDKAFITMLLPKTNWNQMPLMAGNDWARNKPFTNDYLGKDFKLLPKASEEGSAYAIITPNEVRLGKYGNMSERVPPSIDFALREVFAPGGLLDNYFKK